MDERVVISSTTLTDGTELKLQKWLQDGVVYHYQVVTTVGEKKEVHGFSTMHKARKVYRQLDDGGSYEKPKASLRRRRKK